MKKRPNPEVSREERTEKAIDEVVKAYCAGNFVSQRERNDLVEPARAYAAGDKDRFLKSYKRYKAEADNPDWAMKLPFQWRHSYDLSKAMEEFMRIADEE